MQGRVNEAGGQVLEGGNRVALNLGREVLDGTGVFLDRVFLADGLLLILRCEGCALIGAQAACIVGGKASRPEGRALS